MSGGFWVPTPHSMKVKILRGKSVYSLFFDRFLASIIGFDENLSFEFFQKF